MMPAFGESFVGRRDNNEDAFRIREDIGLYLVADGMGGHEGGEIASRIVADIITEYFDSTSTNPAVALHQVSAKSLRTKLRTRMTRAIRSAQVEVERLAIGELAEMGTTLAALVLRDGLALVAHVGDSRVYRLRDGRIERLTDDHSFIGELQQAGALEMLEALPHHYSAMVTRCIAADANGEPDIVALEAREDDVFMLCSDGLTDVLQDATIGEVLKTYSDVNEASKNLIQLAYDSGSQDNITCVVVRAS